MNQILAVEMPKGKKKHKNNIKSIIIVFVVILILFAIGLIATGGYSLYKNSQNRVPIVKTEPQISIQIEDVNFANIVITHDKEISKASYSINEEEPKEIITNNSNEISQKIELPSGEVKIFVTAEDEIGTISTYESSTYDIPKGSEIVLKRLEDKVEVTTKNEIKIKYIMYYWDDDESNAKKFEINDVKNQTLIDVPEGEHELTFIAVDKQENKSMKKQKVKGVVKPKLEVKADETKFYIKAKDESGLSKIQYKFNDGEVITEEIEGEEYNKEIDLENGTNKIMVMIYNKDGVTETAKVKCTKEK